MVKARKNWVRYARSVTVALMLSGLLGVGCVRATTAPPRWQGDVPSGVTGTQPVPTSEMGGHRRSVAHARHGMVAASHPLAVQVGLDVLKAGGTAVDAAIAVNAALGVVEPMMCGMGGDLFALIWDAKAAKLHGLNASGRAPLHISIEKVKPTPEGTIPGQGPASWSVPGAVDGWFEMHQRFGKVPMADLLAPAIRLATEGAPVPRVIAADWLTSGHKGYDTTFLPAPREGAIFRNPDLAASYQAVVDGGRDAFYRGAIARHIVEFSEREGGFFSLPDFDQHRSTWVDPISTDYRGHRVWQIPPNTQGLSVLQILNILETFDLRAMGRASADFWHVLIEAKKLAYEDRARYYADPDHASVPVVQLLDKAYARKRATLIDMKHAAMRQDPGLESGNTTYLAVVDAAGNMVSLIQSNASKCGSMYVPDGLGFCLQNRGASFSLNPKSPNALAPGKRPFHTIIPGFVTRDDKAWLAFGVMGGARQPQGQVQVLVNLIDFEMDLQQAGDAPRFLHEGSSDPNRAAPMRTGGQVSLEGGVPDSVRQELARRGHSFYEDFFFGGYQAVAREATTGVLSGASESRLDGVALGF